MKTKEQVTTEFLAELKNLLTKYDATIDAEDHFQGYPECGEDVKMTVTIPSKYAFNSDMLQEWTEIDLGRHFGP